MNSTLKHSGETLLDVVLREYGTAGALAVVFEANNININDTSVATVTLPEFIPGKTKTFAPVVKKEYEQTLTVESGQYLIDIAIQHYGTAEKLTDLFERFGELKDPQPGEQLTMPVLAVDDKRALAFFRGVRTVAAKTPDVAVGSDQAIIAQGNFLILTKSGSFIKFK